MDIHLKWNGSSGDGKECYVVAAGNDGWKDLRITLSTDDCDAKYAR